MNCYSWESLSNPLSDATLTLGTVRQIPTCSVLFLSLAISEYFSFYTNVKICLANSLWKCYDVTSSTPIYRLIWNEWHPDNTSVQSLSHVQLFVTPWAAALQASLSITNSQSLLKLMSIMSVKPSNHLILCHPLLLPPSIFPSIGAFSNEPVLHIR